MFVKQHYSADLTRWGCGFARYFANSVKNAPPPKSPRLQRTRSPPSDIRSRQKTYLDIAGDEISRLRYVLNEKVKCKVPVWADEKLIDG